MIKLLFLAMVKNAWCKLQIDVRCEIKKTKIDLGELKDLQKTKSRKWYQQNENGYKIYQVRT